MATQGTDYRPSRAVRRYNDELAKWRAERSPAIVASERAEHTPPPVLSPLENLLDEPMRKVEVVPMWRDLSAAMVITRWHAAFPEMTSVQRHRSPVVHDFLLQVLVRRFAVPATWLVESPDFVTTLLADVEALLPDGGALPKPRKGAAIPRVKLSDGFQLSEVCLTWDGTKKFRDQLDYLDHALIREV